MLKPIPNFSRYLASDDGMIFSRSSNAFLSSCPHKGYETIRLKRDDGKIITQQVHRLIAYAFIENVDGKPQIDHIDGNPSNNAVSNLRWATGKENSNNPITKKRICVAQSRRYTRQAERVRTSKSIKAYFRKPGAIEKNRASQHCKRVICKDNGKVYASISAAARDFNSSAASISKCAYGMTKTAAGHKFEFV